MMRSGSDKGWAHNKDATKNTTESSQYSHKTETSAFN